MPLQAHLGAIARIKSTGLRVIVDTGLLDLTTAEGLREADVDQIPFDVVGDADTIRDVLHLDRTPSDYAATLSLVHDVGLAVAPHIVIGLHFGQVRGEPAALDIIHDAGADVIVLVVLRPLPKTPMAGVLPVGSAAVGRLAAVARIQNPTTPLTLGCARPAGAAKVAMEGAAIQAGVNVVAYPDPATVRLAEAMGLQTSFVESCRTLAFTR